MAADKFGVVVIGTGGIGVLHLKLWKAMEDAEVVGVYDVNSKAARKAAREYEVDKVFDSLDAAVSAKKAVAVDICTPNTTHLAAVLAALKAGKHCLCEKPLSPDPAEIERMIAARDKSGKLLMTAQHFRFDERSVALRTLIDAGDLGPVYYSRCWWLRRRLVPAWSRTFMDKSLSGGGPCVDIGVHVLDLTLHFMDFPQPTAVTGVAPCALAKRPGTWNKWGTYDPKDFQVEDFAAGFVRFENGAALALEASWMLNMELEEAYGVRLYGEKGGANWPEVALSHEKAGLLLNTTIANIAEPQAHANELRAFVEAAREGGPSPVPAEQSLAVARILAGLYKSHATGREVTL